jgi:glucan phosphoethanolaminetransferase (alkaline phosphatase superfamily)
MARDGHASRDRFPATRWRRGGIAIGILLLLVPSLVLSILASADKGGWVVAPASLALALAGTTLLMLLSRTWGGFFLASAPIAMLAPLFAWYYAAFREYPDDNAALILLTSTTDESIGWFDTLDLWPWIAAWAVASLLYVVVGTGLWRASLPRRLRRWHARALQPAFVVALALPVRGADGNLHVSPSDAMYIHFTSSYPIGAWLGTVAAGKEALHATGKAVEKRPYAARYAGTDDAEETHVVVIGESARYDAFGIHGYARDTSPALASIPGLVSYSRAYAPANITYLSVPMMLTGIGPESFRPDDIRGSLVDAMREAGFRTAWLSNQEVYVARMLAPPADRWCLPADLERTGWERTRPDGVLLPCLEDELKSPARRRFIVLHTYGSHWDYAHRLPDGAFRYSGLTRKTAATALSTSDRRNALLRDIYDDTILYTSTFLGDVLARLRDVPGRVSFTYIADHGESFRHSEGFGGHGMTRFSVAEAHVPWLFWANDRLASDRADAWRRIAAHRGVPVRGDSLFATVASLAGVAIPGADARKDLTSAAFVPFADPGDIAMLCGGKPARLRDAVDWPAP